MGKIWIFGNLLYLVKVENRAVLLEFKEVGNSERNNETQRYLLAVTFLVGDMTIPEEFVLARKTSIHGDSEDINHKLYLALSKEGLSEEVRSELSDFLIDKFDQGILGGKGTIREKDMLNKLYELLGVSEKNLDRAGMEK